MKLVHDMYTNYTSGDIVQFVSGQTHTMDFCDAIRALFQKKTLINMQLHVNYSSLKITMMKQ